MLTRAASQREREDNGVAGISLHISPLRLTTGLDLLPRNTER